jgi:hypothetical protein
VSKVEARTNKLILNQGKTMTFRPELIDELLKDYQKPEDLMGEGGIFKQLTKALIERCLTAETPKGRTY